MPIPSPEGILGHDTRSTDASPVPTGGFRNTMVFLCDRCRPGQGSE